MEPASALRFPAGAGGARERVGVLVRGAVQGVGFRPLVYRLAVGLELGGWVRNEPDGVGIEIEGPAERLEEFLLRLEREAPAAAAIRDRERRRLAPAGQRDFSIAESEAGGGVRSTVAPADLSSCAACIAEVFDRRDRRFRYPFAACAQCGPRYSIIEALPYDRARTAMKAFPLCGACRREYEDPADRRFHAQSMACPECGPRLCLRSSGGGVLALGDAALGEAAARLRRGAIVAIKGLGGFHLAADARDAGAVARLRRRKRRSEKPLALLYPSLERLRLDCEVGVLEASLLESRAAPIVLVRKSDADTLRGSAAAIEPGGNPRRGALLPYTPLHHLLMAELGFPIVLTSGNLADEPLAIDGDEAVRRLGGVAELFLDHDRPIVRGLDDSVVLCAAGRELVLRLARGYAPLAVPAPGRRGAVLALGAQQKSAVAIARDGEVILGQHVGELSSLESRDAFLASIAGLESLHRLRPEAAACDRHPDYLSSRHGESLRLPLARVQHHLAHARACMAENGLEGPALAVVWDGAGLGDDGTVWGGEFLLVEPPRWRRLAHLRPFRLPGGDRAAREPRRAAIGLLMEAFGGRLDAAADLPPVRGLTPRERRGILAAFEVPGCAPWTSSAGRLFDGLASIIGLRQQASYEGQAAMELEHAIERAPPAGGESVGDSSGEGFRLELSAAETDVREPWSLDWEPLVRRAIDAFRAGAGAGTIARRFHEALVGGILAVARRAGRRTVLLSGGAFQNRFLTERAVERLRQEGLAPFWHRRVPPNDGGLAVGQALAALESPEEVHVPCDPR
jgi:hydrogenase maturation protein HypF